MKGDFSKWGLSPADNFTGVLHQQGRVLLDQDWNAAEQIQALWRETVGQDVIGGGLVAVPMAAPDGLKLIEATATATEVSVRMATGRAWVDGVHIRYDGTTALRADYLTPPFQTPTTTASIVAGTRDAVILEVWDEDFNAFQDPLRLLEPALGGPDTTERVKTNMALKLFRLADGQGCTGLPIDDDFAAKGTLTVTPAPTLVIAGPCPVPDSGGYTGFEHALYRIEIAEPAGSQARFKWSQFNGGLVGRGALTLATATTGTVAITANAQMINQCRLDSYYLEALAFDPVVGHWRVVLTASASLPANDTLALTAINGTWPAGTTGFFRLWNGIERVSDFLASNPLPDGILLDFDAPAADNSNYRPGDYWTFPARAAGVAFDPSVWPTQAPPQGVHYHRASLGILEWTGTPTVTVTAAAGEIHDCRHPFLPLARIRGCCTVTVGDGLHSFGQFTSIQAALNSLPATGGTVCVLGGTYNESIVIDRRVDVRIHGCGPRTRVRAIVDANGGALPAFLITDSTGIVLEDMAIESGPRSAVQIGNARQIGVRRCLVQMRDLQTLWQAIYSRGDDVLIEGNTIEVLPRDGHVPASEIPPPLGDALAPSGVATPPAPINRGHATRGGIQIGGGSDRVRILDNIIRGGIWNGITLGSLQPVDGDDKDDTPDIPGTDDPCTPCRPVDTTDGGDPADGRPRFVSSGDLYDIEIGGNRISDMGINGIGVVRFFDLVRGGDMIGVHGLHIHDNLIVRCLRRELAKIDKAMQMFVGYGGIALAKVSDLRILRNEIAFNGLSHLLPTCGVFAIFVQGLQLDDNRITDNGPKDAQPVADAQPGIRGGVHVWILLPQIEHPVGTKYGTSTVDARYGEAASSMLRRSRAREGASTAAIRDNLIVAPLGRALTFFALGPVTVARNRLVSQGATGRGLDLVATTVLTGNLGISNEWTLGLLLVIILQAFGLLGDGKDNAKYCLYAKMLGLINPEKPPSLWPPLSARWATGKLLMTENQVTLDVIDQPIGVAISSILAFSLDDVGFTDNQCEVSSTNVFFFTQALLAAGSVREADNRLSETWMRAFSSSMSIGGMNTTTDNQSTHCMHASSPLGLLVFRDNLALVRAFCPGDCESGR
ncbi:DUF6519 domain-containing protein [Arenimonas oryziterrae]|uniref:Right handed beta helix domain-containing protein n=1 Tax=Arenimonas oryziterrae DSM 21050 = YC6267 TaxID=1121015 RepID=A0A091BF43_9GAMM|nr:DUF6519 domain-containing protein [Arenimonas oryziterrae]KFN42970.1 hypothetical protein N789_12665 [Arenimonas oryziterrae DSM 21050 = YC6267]